MFQIKFVPIHEDWIRSSEFRIKFASLMAQTMREEIHSSLLRESEDAELPPSVKVVSSGDSVYIEGDKEKLRPLAEDDSGEKNFIKEGVNKALAKLSNVIEEAKSNIPLFQRPLDITTDSIPLLKHWLV